MASRPTLLPSARQFSLCRVMLYRRTTCNSKPSSGRSQSSPPKGKSKTNPPTRSVPKQKARSAPNAAVSPKLADQTDSSSELSAMDGAFFNLSQLFGIMKGAISEDVGSRLMQEFRVGEDKRQSMRVLPLTKIEIPPVEVPAPGRHRSSSFVPREILRRCLKEEAGTAVSSRSVNFQCLLNRRDYDQERRSWHDHRGGGHRKKDNGLPLASDISARNQEVTSAEVGTASLIGDAALLLHEHPIQTEAQLRHALSDERESTTLADGDDTKDTTLITADGAVTDLPEQQTLFTGDGVTADSEEGEEGKRTGDEDVKGALEKAQKEHLEAEKEVEALLPFQDGTIIPLSTHYVTRSERVDPMFQPFRRTSTAQRLNWATSSSDDDASLPPLEGLQNGATIIAVKVLHNKKSTLQGAVDEYHSVCEGLLPSRRKAAALRSPIATCIAIDLHKKYFVDKEEPEIVIQFLDDNGSFQFSDLLDGY